MGRISLPYYTDLFSVLLRWLALFGLAISMGSAGALLGVNGKPNFLAIFVLGLTALWNGFVSTYAIFNRRLPAHRLINVILDILLGAALFLVTGGPVSSIPWVALMPIFSGAMYYGAAGAFFISILMSLFQGIALFLLMNGPFQTLAVGLLIFNLFAGAGIAMLSSPLLGNLRSIYQSQISQVKSSEHTAQQRERDRIKALFAMIETFSFTLRYQTVLETVIHTAITTLNESGDNSEVSPIVGAVLLFGEGQELEMHANRGFSSNDQTIRLPAEQGALKEALQSGEARLVADPAADPELSSLISLHDHSAALCLPLIRGMNAYGVILFAHETKDFFNQERVETLKMLANQAVIAIQNARLYQDLAREKERLIQSQEEAQKKLARDLHDGPTQSISSIAMRVSILRKMLEKAATTPAAKAALKNIIEELVKIEELARHTTKEIRHMLFTLRPLVLETEGLSTALTTIADKMKEIFQQNVVIDVDEDVIQLLDVGRQTVIFNLVEEAVNNARKHAKAEEIRVILQFAKPDRCSARLVIADNGVGFDVQSVLNSYDRRGSLGMINLRERAEQVNGVLKIDSIPGQGTRVEIFLPLADEAPERIYHRR